MAGFSISLRPSGHGLDFGFLSHLYLLVGRRTSAAAAMMQASRFTDGRGLRGQLRKHLDLLRDEVPRLLPGSSNLAVIVLRRNIGVNKSYINVQTGKLAGDNQLGRVMCEFDRSAQRQSPREWFLENLGPENTTSKLVAAFQGRFPSDGWRPGDLAIKGNIPEARYLDAAVRLQRLSDWL